MEPTLIPRQFHIVSASSLPPSNDADRQQAAFDTASGKWLTRHWPQARQASAQASLRSQAANLKNWYNAMHSAVTARHASLSEPLAVPRQIGTSRWAASHSDQVTWGCSSRSYTGPDARQSAAVKVQRILTGNRSDFTAKRLLGLHRKPSGTARSWSQDDSQSQSSSSSDQEEPMFPNLVSVEQDIYERQPCSVPASSGAGLLLGASATDGKLGILSALQVRMLRVENRKQQMLLQMTYAPRATQDSSATAVGVPRSAVARAGTSRGAQESNRGATSSAGDHGWSGAKGPSAVQPALNTTDWVSRATYHNIWAAGPPAAPERTRGGALELRGGGVRQTSGTHSPSRTVSFSEHSPTLSGRSPVSHKAALSSAPRQLSEYSQRAMAEMKRVDESTTAALRSRAEDVQRLAFIAVHEICRTLKGRGPAQAAQTQLLQEVIKQACMWFILVAIQHKRRVSWPALYVCLHQRTLLVCLSQLLHMATTAQQALLRACHLEGTLHREALLRGHRRMEALRRALRSQVLLREETAAHIKTVRAHITACRRIVKFIGECAGRRASRSRTGHYSHGSLYALQSEQPAQKRLSAATKVPHSAWAAPPRLHPACALWT